MKFATAPLAFSAWTAASAHNPEVSDYRQFNVGSPVG